MATTRKDQPFDYYLILDYEATCDDKTKLLPQEIIELPTVPLNAKTLEFEPVFQQYIKPVANPKLTPFCTQLTGIQQDWVDAGLPFQEAQEAHIKWLTEKGYLAEDKNVCFVTCGDWDLGKMLPAQTRVLGIDRHPIFLRWINIKHAFSKHYGVNVKGMTGMLNHLKLKLEGRHHSGIDDCRNIARIAKKMIEEGAILNITATSKDARFQVKQASPLNFVNIGAGKLVMMHSPPKKCFISYKADQGLNHVVSLVTDTEGKRVYEESFRQSMISFTSLPSNLKDLMPKEDSYKSDFKKAVLAVRDMLNDGKHVMIFCTSGMHRSGMFTFGVLTSLGYSDEDAMSVIDKARKAAVKHITTDIKDWVVKALEE